MNPPEKPPVEKILRLLIFLTFLEMSVMGVFLLGARSLEDNAGVSGYSLPRLILLVVWFIGYVVCIWASVSAFNQGGSFGRIRIGAETLVKSDVLYPRVFGWLIVVTVACWGMVFSSLVDPGFLVFISSSLLVLVKQYAVVLFIVGLLAVQCLFVMRRMSPRDANLREGSGSTATDAVLLFLLAFFIYAQTALYLDLATNSRTSYFPELAETFLQGRLDLYDPPATKDLTVFDGRYYVSFPPLGALLMIPFVAWRGAESVNILLFNSFFAALGVAFTFLMLEAMKRLGWIRLHAGGNALLAIFLGFGTAQYYLTERTLVNLISHILTTSFLALALWLAFAGAREQKTSVITLAGAALGLAMLARPNVIFAWIVLAAILFQGQRKAGEFHRPLYLRGLFCLTLPIGIVILGLLWYNQARFGSPLDFGYAYMLLDRPEDLIRYGQFHPHFIPENLFDNFLRTPYWESRCGMFAPNPQGTSIFITSPLLVYLFRSRARDIWVTGAWISVGMIALTHAMYYNSGAIQFGYRFSMDFMPILVALLAIGLRENLSKVTVFLLVSSILVNFAGVLWITHRWCVNF